MPEETFENACHSPLNQEKVTNILASVGEIDDILGRTRTRDKSENVELNTCEYCRCMEMNVNKQIIQPYEFSHSLELFLLYERDAFVK